ncbi:MAG: hypothetical protein IT355_06935 [Gemmatimonadaceae bacterium]|nr:hypothetical protein [Gemmatimonadaceae bacterium]
MSRTVPLALTAAACVLAACAPDRHAPTSAAPPALAPLPPLPPEYHRDVLGSPDTVHSVAVAINASGAIVGTIGTSQLGFSPPMGVMWDASGLPVALGNGLGLAPTDISDYGLITGNRAGRSWVYLTPTKWVQLPLPSGATTTIAAAINWQGTIVGEMTNRKGTQLPVRWMQVRGGRWSAVALPLAAPWIAGGAVDINALGDISGWVSDGSGIDRAWVWYADGQQQEVHKIASHAGLRINNKQEVLLHTWNAHGVVEPTVVHAPSGDQSPKVGLPVGSVASGLNDAGRVVGIAPVSLSFGGAFPDAPVTVLRGSARPAEDLPSSPAANVVPRGTASDVNICGTAVGSLTRFGVGFRRAIRWERIGDCDFDPAPVLRVVPR